VDRELDHMLAVLDKQVLPTGHIFVLLNRMSRFLTQDGGYLTDASGNPLEAPQARPIGWNRFGTRLRQHTAL
jgi:hypothetical protein